MAERNILAWDVAKDYILGGSAVLVIHSATSDTYYRYRIRKKDNEDFAKVTVMPTDMEHGYLGGIRADGRFITKRDPVNSKYRLNIMAFDWSWFIIERPIAAYDLSAIAAKKLILEKVTLYHEGNCSVCGRPLTDPESIRFGVGPKCRGTIGHFNSTR